MAEKLEFDLTVKNNELNKALDDASNKSKTLGNSISTAIGVFAGGLALKGFELLGDAISSANQFAKDSVKAFTEQEDAINRLGQALRASGDFSEQALSDLTAFGSELQKVSKFGDEVVISQIAVAKSFGASNSRAKELVQAAANLSATFGGSLEENVQKLGKTLAGEAGRLAQFIPELKSLTEAQLRAGDAAEIINKRFGGAAASELNTYSGSVIAASNAFSDLQEEIGGLLVNTFNLQGKNSLLKDVYELLTKAVSDYNIESQRNDGTLKENSASIDQLQRKINDLKVEVIDAEQIVNNPSLFDTLLARPVAAAENIKRLNKEIQDTQNILNQASFDVRQVTEESGGGLTEKQRVQITQEELKNAEILSLEEKLANDKKLLDAEVNAAKFIADQEQITLLSDARAQASLDENQRIYELELEKNKALATAEEERLANKKALLSKSIADQAVLGKKEIDLAKQVNTQKVKDLQDAAAVTSQITALGSAIAKDGSKEQFLINKAGALAQVAIARAAGIANALLLPPPAQPAAIAFANITAALSAATIAATTIKGFADGGIVGNSISGASSGQDNRIATVRDGEMILNAPQQKRLFDFINSGDGINVVVQVDGRTIAQVVRDQVRSGFKIA